MHRLLAAVLLFAAAPAEAHTFGAHGAGFMSGVAHPLFGLDHLLAMVAVGLWAGRIGGRARWLVPFAFVAAMGAGSGLAMAGVALPLVEPGILASLLILGLLVAWAPRLPMWAPAAVVALFALAHGHAHGGELPQAASAIGYALGFLAATAVLHGVGLVLPYARWLGLGVAAAGVALVIS